MREEETVLCVQAEIEGEIDHWGATQCERCDRERESEREEYRKYRESESALIDTPVMIKAKETLENVPAFSIHV